MSLISLKQPTDLEWKLSTHWIKKVLEKLEFESLIFKMVESETVWSPSSIHPCANSWEEVKSF